MRKITHSIHLKGRIFLAVCGSLLLLLSYSCTPKSPQAITPKAIRVNSEADSLARTVVSVDSLKMLVEKYASKGDDYGEMVIRRALGEYYQHNSDYLGAIEQHNLSLVLAEQLKDTLEIVETLNLLGRSFRFLGVTGQSAEYHFRALSICEEWSLYDTEEAVKCRIKSHIGIGNVQMVLGNNIPAGEAFRLALQAERTLPNPTREAELYANLGQIRENEGELDSAFVYYERSLELNRGAKSKVGISLCYNHFGRLAEAKNDLDAALRYYYRAYYIMVDEPARESLLESCLSMSRVYLQRGDLEHAREYIDAGWNLAIKVRSWKMLSLACLLKSQYDERIGDTKQAFYWYKKSESYEDSVTNERTRIFVQKIRQQYVSDRYNKELELLRSNYSEAKRSNRAFLSWAILAGVFALMCIVFLLYTLRVRMRSQHMTQHMERVRTDFFTNITHEFRTPLTVMLGLGKKIENWEGGEDREAFQKIGAMIARQGNSLLDLVNQLLDIAKAESAIGKADWRTGDVAPYLSMIVENCQVYAEQKNVLLAYATTERELVIDFVPDYLKKVMQNLLTNAVKYSGEGGKVTVQMGQNGKSMLLTVSDTGRGIPEDDIPYIFDAFYTATNWGIEVSAGVGLAMVKQMVTAMKGTIKVQSELGKGTTFYICLPLSQNDKHFAPLEPTEIPQKEYIPSQYVDKVDVPQDTMADTMKPMVLVVEDNRDVATYIGMQLSDSYRVAYAVNGKEGYSRAQELLPDLIVSDLMMPVMDGYELCREIRKTDLLSSVPIIIVSAKSTENDKLKGLEAGADAYLFKPFSADELLLVIGKLIASSKQLVKSSTAEVETAPQVFMKPHEREFLNRFVDVVYAQMSKGSVDAETLASVMCMSSSQLRRKIFALTGEKLTAYVLKIRLNHARRLLEDRMDLPVADVAAKCAFEDAAYFSRTFKNVYQMTPSQYRKQVGN